MKATPEEPSHSYGHGQFCYYCGIDGDDEVPGVPCPQTIRRPPTEEEMAPYRALCELSEDVSGIAMELEWSDEDQVDAIERRIVERFAEWRRSTSARKTET